MTAIQSQLIVTDQTTPLSLRENVAWTFWGYAIYSACQWGVVIALAKLGTIEMVGKFTLGLAVTAPIVMFTNLQLRGVQATDARQEYSFSDYLGLRIFTSTLALGTIAVVVTAVQWSEETKIVIFLIGVAKVIESLSDVFWGLMQQRERMDWIAKSMMIKGLSSLLALGTALMITNSLVGGVIALTLVWVLTLFCYDIPLTARLFQHSSNRWRERLRPSRLTLVRLLWLSLPLGFVTALESVFFNIPRYAVERFAGEVALGIFGAVAYTQFAAIIVLRAFGQSASPRLAALWNDGNIAAFRDLITKLVVVSVLTGVASLLIVSVVGRDLLIFFYSRAYADQVDVFFLLMLGAMFINIGSSGIYGITAVRNFRGQVYIFGATVACTLLASVLLVPQYQLKGAAIAVVVSSVMHAVLSLIFIANICRQKRFTDRFTIQS